MYSALPTLNNKKITAMFYVHLFLKAMYRKKTIHFFCVSKHLHTSGNTEAESRLHHEGDAEKQRGSQPKRRSWTPVVLANAAAAASSRKPCTHPASRRNWIHRQRKGQKRTMVVTRPDYEAAVLHSHAFPPSAVCFP